MQIGFLNKSRDITDDLGISFSGYRNFNVKQITAEFVLRQLAIQLLCVRSWLFGHQLFPCSERDR